MHHTKPHLKTIWNFVRGDMGPTEFERWACSEVGLENQLGEAFYLETVSVDYSNKNAAYGIRESLEAYAREASNLRCECITLPDLADLGMGEEATSIALRTFETQARQGPALWWLSAEQCTECEQWWLMATDSRLNDVFLLKRLSPKEGEQILKEHQWPEDFDSFEKLLRLGRARGHNWRFMDPLDPSLIWTAAGLARERPGIGVAELAKLLNLDIPHAEHVARKAMQDEGVVIDLEKKDT
jgi:hypothetical protein